MEDRLLELPKGWGLTRLGEICLDPQYGWTTSASNEGKLHLLRTTDITSGSIDWDSVPFCKEEPAEKEKYLLQDGDIVISRAGSVGYSHLIKNPPKTIFASYLIRFKPLIDKQYIAYFLKSPSYWQSISEKSLGIAIPNVNASKLKQIEIPLPPLLEQHRIVAKIEELFTKLDAGIEALKKIKAQLKRYRQTVLKYAFEGKLTQEWREANKGKIEPGSVLLEKIKEERKKDAKGKFKELPPVDISELPELPEGWVWSRIGDISGTIHYGYTASAEADQVGPKILRITDIQDNSVDWESVPYCRIGDSEKGKYLLKEGDLVFARTGATVGKSFLIRGKIPETVFASYLIRIILEKNIDRAYVYDFFQSNHYWSQIHKGKLGIGQPNVNAQVLSKIYIPLTSFHEQNKIVEEIETRLSVADEVEKVVEQSLKQSERLRQSILKQAFEGKLVPQDPSDWPAAELLKQIKKEREAPVCQQAGRRHLGKRRKIEKNLKNEG